MQRKKLNELTIKHNFMFGAVMCEEENCKDFLEMVLQIPIDHVEVSKEKSIIYHPEYKGVRLDVYAKDENHTHYDIEMQALKRTAIEKRSRYYRSHMDMELLRSGEEYDKLPNTYVIFVCDFDPFGGKKYCYTFENMCLEDTNLKLKDGCQSIFLSTYGENEGEVSPELVSFLEYVKASDVENEKNFQDPYVCRLQRSVRQVKENKEMEERYMLFQELLDDERAEGRAQGRMEGLAEGRAEGMIVGKAEAILELLSEMGMVSDELREQIYTEKSIEVLTRWVKLAAGSKSMEQFLKDM